MVSGNGNGHNRSVNNQEIPVIGERQVILALHVDNTMSMALQCELPTKEIIKILNNIVTELTFKSFQEKTIIGL